MRTHDFKVVDGFPVSFDLWRFHFTHMMTCPILNINSAPGFVYGDSVDLMNLGHTVALGVVMHLDLQHSNLQSARTE